MTRFGYRPQATWSQNGESDETTSWSFNQTQITPGPSNTTLLHRPDSGAKMVVQPDVANALRRCSTYRSLESHTDNILSLLPELADHRESTLQTLKSVRDAGLLESTKDAWARLTGASTPSSASSPCRLFITTCDRPGALGRLLDSIAKTPLPDAIEGIWIIDDSREPSSVESNAQLIKEAQPTISRPLVHVDPSYREQLLGYLKNTAGDTSALRWLMDRDQWTGLPTYGIARTLAVLLSVGKRAIVLDDDILLEGIAPPMAAGALRLASGTDREAVFYNSLDEMQSHSLPSDTPLLKIILDALGHSVGHIIASQLRQHTALKGWDGNLLARYRESSTVIMTQCGSWGDTGTNAGTWIFFLPQASVKKLLAHKAGIEDLLAAQATWLGYRHPSITPYGIMSAATGLDNTRLLPPYLPAGRGEDGLFGVMAQRLHPASGVYNPAATVPHLPVEERAERSKLGAVTVLPNRSLLTDWIGQEPMDQWGLNPERRLSGVTEEILRLVEMESADLERLASQLLASKTASMLTTCASHLEQLPLHEGQPGLPAWQAFLEQSRDRLVEQIQTVSTSPLAQTGEGWAQNDFASLRKHGRSFAESLEQWPALREAAQHFVLE